MVKIGFVVSFCAVLMNTRFELCLPHFYLLPNCAGNFSDERLRNRRGAIEHRLVSKFRNLEARPAHLKWET